MKRKSATLGFSVAGMLVAAGMMSGLALVLSQLSKRQMVIQRKAETGVEIAELSQRITRTLQDGDACLATMAQVTTPLANGSTYSINSVMNASGAFLTVNNVYRNRLIRIGAIDLTDVSIPAAPGDDIGQLNLQVTFVKNSKAITGQNKVIKKFPLAVELDPANTLTNNVLGCLSLQDGALDVAKREICPRMGGVYNSDGTCTNRLIGQSCPGDTTATPPTQEYLQGIDANHDLVCALPPPSRSHPAGYNCYLLTTYSFYEMGASRIPFVNNETGIVGDWRMKLAASSSGYIGSFKGNTGLTSFDGKETCDSDYPKEKFHRIRGVSVGGGYEAIALVFHYCCDNPSP